MQDNLSSSVPGTLCKMSAGAKVRDSGRVTKIVHQGNVARRTNLPSGHAWTAAALRSVHSEIPFREGACNRYSGVN